MGISRSGSLSALIAAGAAVLAVTVASPEGIVQRAGGSGTIRGRVTSTAPVVAGSLKVTADEKICGPSVPDEAIVLDREGGVAHAVIAVKGLAWGEMAPVRLTNKGCRFIPHVSVAPPGITLEVTSEDATLHTTHAYAPDGRSLFNVALPLAGLTIRQRVPNATGATRLVCDTHPWMRGFVYVSADRATTSGSDGRFILADVPAGSYDLTVWHERLKGSAQRVSVGTGQTVEVNFVMAAGT